MQKRKSRIHTKKTKRKTVKVRHTKFTIKGRRDITRHHGVSVKDSSVNYYNPLKDR